MTKCVHSLEFPLNKIRSFLFKEQNSESPRLIAELATFSAVKQDGKV